MPGRNQNPFIVWIEIHVKATVAKNVTRYRIVRMDLFLEH